jgi:hypothetical protein
MHTHGQCFLNHDATGRTALRRATRINLHTRTTSIFRFVGRVGDQLIPCGIRNAFRQAVIHDHPRNTQVLKDNQPELGHKATTQFMREVLAPIRNAFVNAAHNPLVILAFGRAFRVLAHATLRPCKRLFIRAKEARIRNILARGEGSELLQANVNANSGTGMFGGLRITTIARHNQIPVISAAREGQGFDCAFNRTMQHDSHVPNVLKVHPITVEFGTIVHHKINGIEAIPPLEARVACRFPTLYAAEEGVKRLVQAPQGLLATGEVGLSKIRVGDAIVVDPEPWLFATLRNQRLAAGMRC